MSGTVINVRSNITAITRWFDDAQKTQIPFAMIYALTKTAIDVKKEEVSVMARVFDRPTPYTLNALQTKPASKANPVASVAFKDAVKGTPAKRFLNPQVYGGERSHKSSELQITPLLTGSFLVPARGVELDQYGNMPGSIYRKIISQLGTSRDATANASGSRKSKKNRKSQAFFISHNRKVVMERKGDAIRPYLVATRAPRYSKRFPFLETGEAVVKERFEINFEIAFQRAMASSTYKGKWR